MFDTKRDPVGQLLRDRVASVSAEVGVPDWRRVIEHQARRRTRRRVRRVSLTVTVMALAATLAIVMPNAGVPRQTGPFHVAFGNYHLMVRDLPAAARAAPLLSGAHVVDLAVSVQTPNHSSIAFGARSAWVVASQATQQASSCGRLVRVSQAKVAATASLPVKLCPNAVAYGSGSVWVLSSQIGMAGYRLAQVNPVTLETTSVTKIDGGRHGVTPTGDTGAKYTLTAATTGYVYVALPRQQGGAQISVLDTANKRLTGRTIIPPVDGAVTALGANETSVWAGTANGWVLGLDPGTAAIRAARHLGTRVVSLSVASTGVWVSVNLPTPAHASYPGLDVLRLDPVTGALARDTGLPMTFVATDGSSVWALGSAPPYQSAAGLVAQLDPATGAIIRRAQLPAPGYETPDTIGVSAGRAWVLNDFLGRVARITP